MCGILDEKMNGTVKDMLHDAADCLEVSENLKERIDRRIAVKTPYSGCTQRKNKRNLATICLSLSESMESDARDKNIVVKCLPSDDAFDKKVMVGDYTCLAMRKVVLGLITRYGVAGQEISLCTEGNCIRLNGIHIPPEGLNECCMKNRSGYQIAASEMGLAFAYMDMAGVKVQSDISAGVLRIELRDR